MLIVFLYNNRNDGCFDGNVNKLRGYHAHINYLVREQRCVEAGTGNSGEMS